MTRFPLSWPEGWRRTPAERRTRAKFSKGVRQYSSTPGGSSYVRQQDLTVADAVSRVLGALRLFGVPEGEAIISTNVQVRLDGLPKSGQAMPKDPGAAVYWRRPDDAAPKVMAIDQYDRVEHNLAAIAATLEAMRAIERHGGARILDRAFAGFTALPAPGQTQGCSWREVLGLGADERYSEALITERYRALASKYHPDKPGGDVAKFQELGAARLQALEALKAGG